MTTVFAAEVTCAVCGRKQRVQKMGSTSSFGPMDLDTRPPSVRRQSLWLWVHECEARRVQGVSRRAQPARS